MGACPANKLPGAPPDIWLRRLLANHLAGGARFPAAMGLPPGQYRELARRLRLDPGPRSAVLQQQDALLALLARTRQPECRALGDWLAQYMCAGAEPLNRLIAAASLGFNHLWQDLGLASRGELRELMQACFPELVVMNQGNMRWKKFFYRQVCLAETGEVTCRSPSCDSCCERESCFAPED
ncbi:nitrogen fixation protein NifQ [Acerihabitans arboris]|uniref:Nitrogen fixation protein NifQ n=1 Tax=Acerihabitans arboris TaxID=2691583 RepID=A0A845SIX4_9GAMM|nr:nitrogen fixation protein NifQ [Acerihabitans arboris]NDL62976.1 nitrogen fixation protein NifQ [Acerihabitans arboris]